MQKIKQDRVFVHSLNVHVLYNHFRPWTRSGLYFSLVITRTTRTKRNKKNPCINFLRRNGTITMGMKFGTENLLTKKKDLGTTVTETFAHITFVPKLFWAQIIFDLNSFGHKFFFSKFF